MRRTPAWACYPNVSWICCRRRKRHLASMADRPGGLPQRRDLTASSCSARRRWRPGRPGSALVSRWRRASDIRRCDGLSQQPDALALARPEHAAHPYQRPDANFTPWVASVGHQHASTPRPPGLAPTCGTTRFASHPCPAGRSRPTRSYSICRCSTMTTLALGRRVHRARHADNLNGGSGNKDGWQQHPRRITPMSRRSMAWPIWLVQDTPQVFYRALICCASSTDAAPTGSTTGCCSGRRRAPAARSSSTTGARPDHPPARRGGERRRQGRSTARGVHGQQRAGQSSPRASSFVAPGVVLQASRRDAEAGTARVTLIASQLDAGAGGRVPGACGTPPRAQLPGALDAMFASAARERKLGDARREQHRRWPRSSCGRRRAQRVLLRDVRTRRRRGAQAAQR